MRTSKRWAVAVTFALLAPVWAHVGSARIISIGGRTEAARSAVVPLRGTSSLRPGALATGELQLVGLQLKLPTKRIDIPQGSPFVVKVSLWVGDHEASVDEAIKLAPADSVLEGTISGPGITAQTVTGTLGSGLSMPALTQEGDYVLSGVKATIIGRGVVDADPSTLSIHCLGQVLISQVTSSPMTLQEIKDSGIPLGPGSYEGHRFTMALTIGSQAVNLSVPVAIPVYNGLIDPRDSGAAFGRLEIEGTGPGGGLPDLTVVGADIKPDNDPFTLSRPGVSHTLHNNFKALLVIPGSIGYLKQFYKANVVVFNTLKPDSPYVVSHVSAIYNPPPAADGLDALQLVSHYEAGTGSIDTNPKKAVRTADDSGHPGQGADQLKGGDSGMATFYFQGTKEGSHPLDFVIEGQFEGGDLAEPIPLHGIASGKVLIRNPKFNLLLVHPDVVRKGEVYTLEARVTNTSGTIANLVSLTIDQARLASVKLVSNPNQSVDTLLPGDTASFKYELRAMATGEVKSSYLYLEEGGSVSFQLSTGLGERNIKLNPDTLTLPQNLDAIPSDLREAMLRVLGQAYSIATTKDALPSGVLPISRGVITDKIASGLSEQGLALKMGADRARVWWSLWNLFEQNSDPGFDQLMRTTEAGQQLSQAFLKNWAWADASQGLVDRFGEVATFGYGSQRKVLVAMQGAADGVGISVIDPNGIVQSAHQLGLAGTALAESEGVKLFEMAANQQGSYQLVLNNTSSSPQTLKVVAVAPGASSGAPVMNQYSFEIGWKMLATLDLGVDRAPSFVGRYTDGTEMYRTQPIQTLDAPAEPFQVLAVHRYDQEVSPEAAPYGTQVLMLFNRATMPLQIADGDDGFQQSQALLSVDGNAPWRKVMGYQLDPISNEPMRGPDGGLLRLPSPAALTRPFPSVVSLYLEKPVGPYVQRTLTLFDGWRDENGNGLQGTRSWPIRSGLVPGGAQVRGRLRKADGTGVPGHLTYWYFQWVNGGQLDLATNQTFSDEMVDQYYALVTNNVATEADGSFQMDYVPEAYADYIGPFVLQGNVDGTEGGAAFAQASVLGNGQLIQMDLVLEGKGSIEGYVVDAQGNGISGARVQATQEQQTISLNRGTGGGAFQLEALSDGQGHYRLDGVKTGVFSMRALKGFLGVSVSGELKRDGEVIRQDLLLKGAVGQVKVQLLDLLGQPVMDQFIRLGFPAGLIRDANASSPIQYVYPQQAKPDGDGWVRFSSVPAGDFHVVVPNLYRADVTDFHGYLEPGAEKSVVLHLVPATQQARVKILVVDGLGQPVPNAYVKHGLETSAGYSAVTGDDGYSPWMSLPEGRTARSSAYHPNWVGETLGETAALEAGKDYVLRVQMSAKSTLTGRVTRKDGTPVKGAYVAIPPVYDDAKLNRLTITDAAGHYVLPGVVPNHPFRLAVVGPDLRTSANVQVQVGTNATEVVDMVLPLNVSNTVKGTVYQPKEGTQKIPTMATVWATALLPSVDASSVGNEGWGLLFNEEVANGSTLPDGTFSLKNLPMGPYTLYGNSDFFPVVATLDGTFEYEANAPHPVQDRELFLLSSFAGELKGRVYLRDGQTLVGKGVRVILKGGTIGEATVLTQEDGTYKFAKVIPEGWYRLRAEDPTTGDIISIPIEMKKEESQTRNLRLWGKGTLTIHVQDSLGNVLPEGVIELVHSKAQSNGYVPNILEPTDLPEMQQKLLPSNQGLLQFQDLFEGTVSVRLHSPGGLEGVASVDMPVGGGDAQVTIRLQPVGNISGLLKRPDGTLISAGRVDAYDLSGRWLGVSPTAMGGETGRFIFQSLPTGAIKLEAFDPDTRQVGRATVMVLENQVTQIEITTLDLGPVTVQVLQAGNPVLRAGIRVRYIGGPALDFTTEATADASGSASFSLPPGDFRVTVTDPVSLATGDLTFTRIPNQGALNFLINVAAVRTLMANVLPPPGSKNLSLQGWKLNVESLNRMVLLDDQGSGVLNDIPAGGQFLALSDAMGNPRGRFPVVVQADGPVIQPVQVTALAIGTVIAHLVDQAGQPIRMTPTYMRGAQVVLENPLTNLDGDATFSRVLQGSGTVFGNGTEESKFALDAEGQVVRVDVKAIPTGAVHGTVTLPSGVPAAFISVKTSREFQWYETATDAQGRYVLSGLPLNTPLTLTATAGDGRTGIAGAFTLTQPAQDLQGDIVLQARAGLSGVFTDALRPQLPVLRVSVLSNSTPIASGSTDPDGAFAFPSLPAGVPLTLRAMWDDESTVAFQETFTLQGEGLNLVMNRALAPFVDVKGWTLNASGQKIPMTVQVWDESASSLIAQAVTTGDLFDPDHPTFFFRYLKGGYTYRLVGLDSVTRAPLATQLITPMGTQPMEIVNVQTNGGQVSVSIHDAAGMPASGVTVTLKNTSTRWIYPTLTAVTDTTGIANFPSVLEGHIEIAAVFKGRTLRSAGTMGTAGSLAFDLKDQGNGGAQILVHYSTGIPPRFPSLVVLKDSLGIDHQAWTDTNGTVAFSNLPYGQATIAATHPTSREVKTLLLQIPDGGVASGSVVFSPAAGEGKGDVHATVTYAVGGAAAEGAIVTFRDSLGSESYGRVDANGTVSFLSAHSGPATLRATHPTSHIETVISVQVLDGATNEAALSLSIGGTFVAQVRGANGQPISGKAVWIFKGTQNIASITTDANGMATAPFLPLRTPLTVKDANGDGSAWNPKFPDQPLTFQNEGESVTQNVGLPLGELSVSVIDGSTHQPASGASVTLVTSRYSQLTDANGVARFTSVALDMPFSVSISSTMRGNVNLPVTITSANPTGSLSVTLSSAANLYVQAIRANGQGAPSSTWNAWAWSLTPESGTVSTLLTSYPGNTWANLPLGTYTVSLTRKVGTDQSGDMNNIWPTAFDWAAQTKVQLDGSQENVSAILRLPAMAALTLHVQDAAGNPLTLNRVATLKLESTTTPGFSLPNRPFYAWDSYSTLVFGEHFPEGTHTFVVMDDWFGPIARIQIPVNAAVDGQRIDQAVRAALPAAAALHLSMTDLQGRPLQQPHDLSLVLVQTTSQNYAPAPLPAGGGDLFKAFPVGTHQFKIVDSAFGEVGQLTFTVSNTDIDTVIEKVVSLNYVRASWATKVVAGDHETPVPTGTLQLDGQDNVFSMSLPADGTKVDLEVVPGKVFRTTASWLARNATDPVVAHGNTRSIGEGNNILETLELPLTVVRAWLKDQDGTTSLKGVRILPEGEVPNPDDDGHTPADGEVTNRDLWVDPQGKTWAIYFGAPAGKDLRFRIWDGESGLGQILPITVSDLGTRSELVAQMPPYALATVRVVNGDGNVLDRIQGGLPVNTDGVAASWHAVAFASYDSDTNQSQVGPRKVPLSATTFWVRSYFNSDGYKYFQGPASLPLPIGTAPGQRLEIQVVYNPTAVSYAQVQAVKSDGSTFNDGGESIQGTLVLDMPSLPYGFNSQSTEFLELPLQDSNSVSIGIVEGIPFSIHATASGRGRLWQGDLTPTVPPGGFVDPILLPLIDAGPQPLMGLAKGQTSAQSLAHRPVTALPKVGAQRPTSRSGSSVRSGVVAAAPTHSGLR